MIPANEDRAKLGAMRGPDNITPSRAEIKARNRLEWADILVPDGDPLAKQEVFLDYLSPHCAHGNCKWCKERRRRAQVRAQTPPDGAFWDSKITRGYQSDEGPRGGGPIDVLGYWPAPRANVYLKSKHAGGPRHRPVNNFSFKGGK